MESFPRHRSAFWKLIRLEKRHRARSRTLSGGFTLIELLVVLAIMIVIIGIVITNQSTFNKSIILANTAYDVALSFRSAETYGINSRVEGAVANAGYGLDFQAAFPNSYVLFADTYPGPATSGCHPAADVSRPDAISGNCVYDAGTGQDSLVSRYNLGNGAQVSDICAYEQGGTTCSGGGFGGGYSYCFTSPSSWVCGLQKLDVVFARPNPQPYISVNGSYLSTASRACIKLVSQQGGSKFVTISSSGEISESATACQ